MQIREQGRQVQLIRSPYDSAKKRCTQKVVHTFKSSVLYSTDDIKKCLSDEQLLDLSADEIQTVEVWIKARFNNSAQNSRSYSIMMASQTINSLADAILSDGLTDQQAANIWLAIDALAKSMKKSGHAKSAKKALNVVEKQILIDI